MSGPSSSNAQGSASASASASNSATGTTYTLSPEAYALPLLHAALHPSSTVTGLFLSPLSSNPSSASAAVPDAASPTLNNKQDGGTSSNAVPQQADEINITHSIPLQHTYTSLTPYTEIGLELAQAYAEDQGLRVVGMYVARGDDAAPKAGEGLGRIGERMLGVLREGWQGAFGLLIDNDRLGSGEAAYSIFLSTSSSSSPLKAIPHSASSTSALPSPFVLEPSIPAKVLKSIRQDRVHRGVKDLDDHLEDASADWLDNPLVKQELKRVFSS